MRATRKLTGKPPWPMVLLAGPGKTGKTYAAALAASSALVGRTLWVGVGENDPDEFGVLPGVDPDYVPHDGTYRDILAALDECAGELPVDGKPSLLILDSASRVWDLLCEEQQVEANRRAAVKAKKYNKPIGDEDATITMDQWNTAKQRWAHIMDTLRAHNGPVVITARAEVTTIVDKDGAPTKEKDWKVKAEKSLPFDVDAIVEMHALNDVWLTGVRSLRYKPTAQRTEYPNFTVEDLWLKMGLADEAGHRTHASIDPEDRPARAADEARRELAAACVEKGWELDKVAALYLEASEGTALRDATSAPAIRHFAAGLEKTFAKDPDVH